LNDVQDRFEVNITELPEEIDISSYSEFLKTDKHENLIAPNIALKVF
jgi:hypothetical protein